MGYSAEQLYQIGAACTASGSRPSVSPEGFVNINKLGINSVPPTIRGTRAGCRKQRAIGCIWSHRDSASAGRGVDKSNLTPVDTVRPPPTTRLKAAHLNTRSACRHGKSDQIQALIIDNQLDICSLTETWFKGRHPAVKAVTPPGYRITQLPRSSAPGGGVAVIHRSTLVIVKTVPREYTTMECLELLIKSGTDHLRLVTIYRPPPKAGSPGVPKFMEEFADLLDYLTLSSGHLLVVGDFNIHLDEPSKPAPGQFNDLISSTNLVQHVSQSTHSQGHILDVVITRRDDLSVLDMDLDNSVKSDHTAVIFTLPLHAPPPLRKQLCYRKWRDIDREAFSRDILSSDLMALDTMSAVEAVDTYNKDLSELMDQHAPTIQRTITIKPHAPWFNITIKVARAERRRLEKQWRRTGLTVHKEMHEQQCTTVSELCENTKESYYQTKLSGVRDQQQLYRIANPLLHREKVQTLPTHTSPKDLAEKFATYFHDKIEALRSSLASSTTDRVDTVRPDVPSPAGGGATLRVFRPATESEVRKLLAKTAKTCTLDPVPSGIVKDCTDVLVKPTTVIINKCLTEGMPDVLKSAIVTPILKKHHLDPEIFKNFRPISNLSSLAKLVEKFVADRLIEHIHGNNLFEPLQSAYRQFCSVETALLKVQDDILRSLDQRKGVLLLLLDLSAAFDTVDHGLLLHTLEHTFRVTDQCLDWVASYLSNRQQTVAISGHHSSSRTLVCGVPQGSVLGPLLFTMYTTPLAMAIREHGSFYHLYADDTQLYLEFVLGSDASSADWVGALERCVGTVRTWMHTHLLKLNDDKTELLVLHPKTATPKEIAKLPRSVTVGNSEVVSVRSARNIGAVFDVTMSMEEHVAGLCRSAYYHLHSISRVRRYIDMQCAKQLVHALVISRLDTCNSLLYGLPDSLIKKLERVQNSCARVILQRSRLDHVKPMLIELHWLPIDLRVIYKILTLCYKCLHGEAPGYLSDLVTPYRPTRALRSAEQLRLNEQSARTKFYGDRRFSVAAPKLWNNLPVGIRKCATLRHFKVSLKTHLFKSYTARQ